MIKNDGFDKNGGHHELRHEKIMNFESGDVDFGATVTHLVNIFVFYISLWGRRPFMGASGGAEPPRERRKKDIGIMTPGKGGPKSGK